jgi:adenine-specific DNA-methyltransferase
MATKKSTPLTVEALKHEDATRRNIPTAEFQSVMHEEQQTSKQVRYPRNTDLDPQLVWRGKDEQDWSDLVVNAPPLYIQEKVHPKVLIDDLLRTTREREHEAGQSTADLFSDFNGIPKGADKTEFYQHDQNWTNRMILGDSLQVMASLAEREGLRGKVQCIYFDPPYGIKFNSNFQWSTTSRDVKDGKADHITREPEQVKAFRDTWRDGIHSYLTYLRDRLTVARDLLTESGSIFVQIGDENVHRVRAVMDEVFGDENFVSEIIVIKSSGLGANTLPRQNDFILMYAKSAPALKYRQLFKAKSLDGEGAGAYQSAKSLDGTIRRLSREEIDAPETIPPEFTALRFGDLTKPGPGAKYEIEFQGNIYSSKSRWWGMPKVALQCAIKADRISGSASTLSYQRLLSDWSAFPLTNIWADTGTGSGLNKVYVVQTDEKIVQRCVLMASDPGDLILDPTCGSGTTATIGEQWGRRWITIDTSRVALALARARIMGARYPFYLLADSREGQIKEGEITRTAPSTKPALGNVRHGFVYERVPHITLKSIANNAEIDVIWDKWQATLEPLRDKLNAVLMTNWQEWEIPRELALATSTAGKIKNDSDSRKIDEGQEAKTLLTAWWQARIARQKEIDASIAAKAEFEYLYDKPYENKKCVRVAGPFTVESLSPHRMMGVDENDGLIDHLKSDAAEFQARQSFPQMILDNLKTAGVQQANKSDRISFTALTPWPGEGAISAEGRYMEGELEKRAGIFIGPEFGTVQRSDLVEAARECGDAGFDVLIACAFNYEAHATEFSKLGRIPVLKARMNADLHMAEDLKNTGKGNLFVIFGEPDIEMQDAGDGKVCVKINGVDVFHPNTGEVRSDGADGIACWFIDTDYNEESFFVRHAYFLGANDPYSALKTTLKAEIDAEAWATLNSDVSRPFDKPKTGRFAVKVINHLGDEVMKVFRVE